MVGTPLRGASFSTVEPVSVVETEPVIEVQSPGVEDLEDIAEERKEVGKSMQKELISTFFNGFGVFLHGFSWVFMDFP